MRGKKFTALMTGFIFCGSLLIGCGQNGSGSEASTSVEESAETDTNITENEAENESETAEEQEQEEAAATTTDPVEMIYEGYYSYTYAVEGMDDMCAYFHFYEEQPVLGSVFYAGFAWNQINYAGTYSVEETETEYSVYMDRESQEAETKTDGTAPYKVTFYDFDGNELGSCAYDGEYLYNDSDVTGIGAEECVMTHDTDENSAYMDTYLGEAGVTYMDFVAADPTSTLTLYHNGRYMDLVDMMVEGDWIMEENTDGLVFTLTPDYDTDTAATFTVTSDKSAGIYTPDDGESVEMSNTAISAPVAVYELTGEVPIPGQEFNGTLIATAYDDGTIEMIVDIYGTQRDIDAGTWTEQDGQLTIVFEIAGETITEMDEDGSNVLHYVASTADLGDVDTVLTVAEAAAN